jgi:hypothetical protein
MQVGSIVQSNLVATWITHLRLAEHLIQRGLSADADLFLVGSVAPDAGVPNADGTGFAPPKRITHWRNGDGVTDAEAYYRRYLDAPKQNKQERGFHIGYYLHLLADRAWDECIWQPKKRTPLYLKAMVNMTSAMQEIKNDWYGLDFLYLKAQPDSIYYRRFRYLDNVPDYLDYFAAGMLTENIKKIQRFYRSPNFDLQRPYDLTLEQLTHVCQQKRWL